MQNPLLRNLDLATTPGADTNEEGKGGVSVSLFTYLLSSEDLLWHLHALRPEASADWLFPFLERYIPLSAFRPLGIDRSTRIARREQAYHILPQRMRDAPRCIGRRRCDRYKRPRRVSSAWARTCASSHILASRCRAHDEELTKASNGPRNTLLGRY